MEEIYGKKSVKFSVFESQHPHRHVGALRSKKMEDST